MNKLTKKIISAVVAAATAMSTAVTSFAAPAIFYEKDNFTYLTASEKTALDNAVAKVVSQVQSSWSTINKILFVHDYICTHAKYDTTYKHSHAYDNLIGGTSVCQGYSEAFDMIMEKLNIPCHMILSYSLNHSWNIVKLDDGKWYHVDVTWDDPLPDAEGRAMHDYFLLSDAAMNATNHKASDWLIYDEDKPSDMPSPYGNATSTKYDRGMYWKNAQTPIAFSGDYNFALSDSKIKKYDLNGKAVSTVVDLSSERWYAWGSSNSYWIGAFSGFGQFDGRLYYNTPTAIYSVKSDGTDKKTVYTLTSAEKAGGNIYTFYIKDDKLTYTTSKSPNYESTDNVKTNTITLKKAPAVTSLSTPTLSATSTSDTISLKWNAVANAEGYVIEQKINGAWVAKAKISSGATTSYKFTGKSEFTNYYYRIKAVNGSVNSAYSSVTLKTLLAPPSNLTATTTASAVTLKWNANTKATGYVIQQKVNGVWSTKATINDKNKTSYTFTGKSQFTNYYYRVKAVNGSYNGEYSSVTKKTLLAAPASLTATTTKSTVSLKWNANAKATGYVIQQKINGVWYTKATINDKNKTSYTFTGKKGATTYYYRVKAVNGSESGTYSSVTTKTK